MFALKAIGDLPGDRGTANTDAEADYSRFVAAEDDARRIMHLRRGHWLAPSVWMVPSISGSSERSDFGAGGLDLTQMPTDQLTAAIRLGILSLDVLPSSVRDRYLTRASTTSSKAATRRLLETLSGQLATTDDETPRP
jgi:hypothetical protein